MVVGTVLVIIVVLSMDIAVIHLLIVMLYLKKHLMVLLPHYRLIALGIGVLGVFVTVFAMVKMQHLRQEQEQECIQ
jgi:hypothetical protein